MEMSGLVFFFFSLLVLALSQRPGRVPLIQLAQAHMKADEEGGLCNCVSRRPQNANAMKITS